MEAAEIKAVPAAGKRETPRTSLSVGLIVRKLLSEDPGVSAMARKIFPVAVDKAELPYVVFRVAGDEPTPVKPEAKRNDTVAVEVICLGKTYEQAVQLSELVRAVLDCKQGEVDGLRMRRCLLADQEDAWEDDAYVKILTFSIQC